MKKQFKPVIKHDEVTQTYTIRDKKGVVIQVPDVIIDELDNYYKAECERLERENEKLKEELLQSDYVKASVFSDREEYKKQIVKLHEELKTIKLQNEELKRKR